MRLPLRNVLLLTATLFIHPIRSANVQMNVGSTPVARVFTEVRLRKLHLARPDLISYPFAYEVYC